MPAEGGIAKFMDGNEDLDYNGYPDTVPRRCGDMPCCCVFLFCCLVTGITLGYTVDNGNLSRYEGLTDYNGKFCGVSSSVVNKPFLYFCQDSVTLTIQRRDRICVENCDVAARMCPAGGTTAPYNTINYAGILCMPTEERLRRQISEDFLLDPDIGLFLAGVAFSRAWPAIFLSVVVAIVLAFLYLCVIARCKRVLILFSTLLIVLVGAMTGTYLVMLGVTTGADGIAKSGDEFVSLWVGILTLLMSFSLLCILFLFRKSINASIACIKAGSECIWDSPSLVFEPFLQLSMKLCALVVIMSGLLRLLTWMDYRATEYAGEVSIRVRLSYSPINLALIAHYIFWSVWVMEALNGFSWFSTAYAAQQWFFAPYDTALQSKETSSCSTCKGYLVAFRYHTATIIYGAFCIFTFRFPRMILGNMFYGADDESNKVASLLVKMCSCCANAYNGFLKYMSPYGYMDVVLNGSRWCKAAYFAEKTMEHSSIEFFCSHGASWLVQFIGHCLVSAVGGLHTYVLCRSGYVFGEVGVQYAQNDFYIPRPSIMGLCAAIICWGTAHPFLVLPGHVADNLLFCYGVERKRAHSNPIKTAVESASMLTRLTTCVGREDIKQHQTGSTRAQPPNTHALLEEAKHDADSWWW